MPDRQVPSVRLGRYLLGTAWRVFTLPVRQHRIRLADATTIFGCSLGGDGWHPLVETLREYESDPSITWRDTTLYRYHTRFCPQSICDLIEERPCQIPLFHFPWGMFNVGLSGTKDVWQSRFCGPSEDEFIREEFSRLVELYSSIKKSGYRPWRRGHSFVCGTFLEAIDGARRFVVMQGNHRLAALGALGVTKVSIRTDPRILQVTVFERDLLSWPMVRDGRVSAQAALAIFKLFFTENGNHVRQWVEERRTRGSATATRCSLGQP